LSGLASRIVEARNRQESVGPRAYLLPSSLLGASLVAVAATESDAPTAHLEPEATDAPTMLPGELPPEAHVRTKIDVPPPPPLAALRGAEMELAYLDANLVEPTPLPRFKLQKKTSSAKTQVKKMSEPIVRMKNGNGNHKGNGHAVVQVMVKKKAPSLDAPEKALAWLQGMVKKVHVSAIPTMLDYYRRLGWIPNEAYGWLVELSTGLTKSAQPATWRMVRNDPAQLAIIHRESYKHLKGLFGERMNRSV